MPRTSTRQLLLSELENVQLDLKVAHFLELALRALDEIAELDSDDSSSSQSNMSTSLTATLQDEVSKSCTLFSRPRASCAPQLHLLEEWALTHPEKFRHKLRVDPEVFVEIVNRISAHPIFYNNSNNPQLAVPVQLAIFLNGIGHYGNAATPEDVAEWAGVSLGTVYNCYNRVMIAILHHHDALMFFDPLDPVDQADRERSKCWVEEGTCKEWRGGFLCVDGTPFNVFQKPGWHGEGFFDRKSNYSLSAQVVILPHSLRIVDYVIGVPGSLHDANVFSKTRISRHPNTFLGANEWLWADSAYGSRPWDSSSPFVNSGFKSNLKDLKFANSWTRCCLILHNMIIDIEEQLERESSNDFFARDGDGPAEHGPGEEDPSHEDEGSGEGDEGFIGSEGQIFRQKVMRHLLRHLN
ncbi:hypothetical protein M405DRAFT_892540 [Rhizopogon salebrosus TDB-379]|nr:hypothetical protein M405DRAFT_892540 [Rhizopogon salebrosus TDB-379]